MSPYIQVAEEEGDEPMEVPVEDDGTLLLTTLAAQFPGSCGLKYRNPDTGSMRGIRLSDGRLYPPDCDWGGYVFIAVFPKAENKRRVDEAADNMALKPKRINEKQRCSDLIVLGLPWKSNEEDLKKYFLQFGELLMVQVKKDPKTGQSKGFGFVRFADYEAQFKCISQRHMIDGRWCDVRIPNSKNCILQEGAQQMMNRKVFVGRCTEDMTSDDLRHHFSKYGEVVDVFIPKPFRAFAFVTFADPDIAQSLCGEDHIIKGASVHISGAAPKNNEKDRRLGLNHTPFGAFGQGYSHSSWAPGTRGTNQSVASHGTALQGSLNNNLGLGNLGLGALQLNHAMLAAAQAVLSGQGGWGPLGLTNQGGSASSGDNQTNTANNNAGFSTIGNGTSCAGNGGSFLGWGSSQTTDAPSHSPGHVGGWGSQSKTGTGWN